MRSRGGISTSGLGGRIAVNMSPGVENRFALIDTFDSLVKEIHLIVGGDPDRVKRVLRVFSQYLEYCPDLQGKEAIIDFLKKPKPQLTVAGAIRAKEAKHKQKMDRLLKKGVKFKVCQTKKCKNKPEYGRYCKPCEENREPFRQENYLKSKKSTGVGRRD